MTEISQSWEESYQLRYKRHLEHQTDKKPKDKQTKERMSPHIVMRHKFKGHSAPPKFELRVCIKQASDCLERNTSHRAVLNAHYRKILKIKNTEKLHPGWQLQGEESKQFNKSQEHAVHLAIWPWISRTGLDSFPWDFSGHGVETKMASAETRWRKLYSVTFPIGPSEWVNHGLILFQKVVVSPKDH